MHQIQQTQHRHHKEDNMTKKQTRLEKVREKNVEVEEFPKVEENMTENQTLLEKVREKNAKIEKSRRERMVKSIEEQEIHNNKRTPIVLEEETMVEHIPKVEKYATKTYLVKDILVGQK